MVELTIIELVEEEDEEDDDDDLDELVLSCVVALVNPSLASLFPLLLSPSSSKMHKHLTIVCSNQ